MIIAQRERNVLVVTASPALPRSWVRRSFTSFAARFVNDRQRIEDAAIPLSIAYAARRARTLVLPVPIGAISRTGFVTSSTARFCSGLRFPKSIATGSSLLKPERPTQFPTTYLLSDTLSIILT